MDMSDMNEQQERGLAIRRQVLGDAYVDGVLSKVTDYNAPLQDLLNEYCWGGPWLRDGLDLKTRSLINLAMMTAMNRPHELAVHTRGALRNGVTTDEIREVLLQAAIYCGVPAALDSFRVTAEVIDQYNSEQ
jgi:4-carboxymuconolactone decarboxylase